MKMLKALLPTLAAVIFAVGVSHADFLYRWSQTAGSNANSDTFTWAEGQAPSTVNDSARGMMAAIAKWRDDTSGKLVTAGSATVYTLATNQVFNTLAAMDGALLSFRMNATSGAAPTLNVDGLGAKALNQATGVAVATGALISGAVYSAVYVNASSEWIVRDIGGAIPSGTTMVAATACPTGWTTGATHNDKALRLMTSAPGTAAGTVAFSTLFGRTATDGFTISKTNFVAGTTFVLSGNSGPSGSLDHQHSYTAPGAASTAQAGVGVTVSQAPAGDVTGFSTAGSLSHVHDLSSGSALSGGTSTPLTAPIDTRVQYVQVVLCTKN